MVRALEVVTTFSLGLLAGAMLLIGGAIVPYWFSLEPLAVSAWFGRNASFLGNVMVPLGGITTLLALVTAAFAWRTRCPARVYFGLAATLAAAVAAIYLIEHQSLNARLEAQSLSADQVEIVLRSWRAWHWARVGAGAAGFVAALLGLVRSASVASRGPAVQQGAAADGPRRAQSRFGGLLAFNRNASAIVGGAGPQLSTRSVEA